MSSMMDISSSLPFADLLYVRVLWLSKISNPLLLEQYVAVDDYREEGPNETSLTAGALVEVVEKAETGILTLTALVTTIDALQHFETG